MLQLKNASPFAPALSVLPNKDGVDTLYVTVRGAFALLPRLAILPKPEPPVLADEYWGEPAQSSLKYASELHVGKPTTDVILMGQAWSPAGRVAETSMMVSVANRSKTVKVFGDRAWTATGGFTSPAPFESIPLVYERAFGGHHRVSDQVLLAEERNPVGLGFVGKRSIYEMIGQKLPNFEDPRALIGRLGDAPPPACFGFVAPSWLPRRQYAGTYDKAWQKQRAPYLPADFDPRFFSAASPELTFDRYLQGGEPVQVLGACQQGALRFELPRCRVKAKVKIAGAEESPPFNLETVLIEPDDNRVSISWRAQLICDKKVLRVEMVTIDVEGLDLSHRGGQLSARAVIRATGAVCAVGIGTEQTWASIRTGIARFTDSSVHDRYFEPIRMALLPEDALEPLLPPVDKIPFTARRRRMLRLAAPALRQALKGFEGAPPPLFIGLPPTAPEPAGLPDAAFVDALAAQAGVAFDKAGTQLFPRGRAAALLALEAGLKALDERRVETVMVGGVDTYLNLALLGQLGVEQRILGPRVMDGFIPGEGAAFVVLTRPGGRTQPHPGVAVFGAGTAQDPGHRYSAQPAKGEGLSFAIDRMLTAFGQPPAPIQTTFAGFNGENFGAKEWGVARIRHADLFAATMKLEHPADCFGDTGAAMGALLLAVANASLLTTQRSTPALVWVSSDREDRACAYLDSLA